MTFLGGSLLSQLGKNIRLCRGEGNIMAVGKNITWKTGKGEAISTYRLLEKEGREAKRVL